MNASRAAVLVVGVNLIAVWGAAAAGGRAEQPQGPPDPQIRQDRAVVQAQAALVEATDRLRRHTGPPVEDAVVRRDPFSFPGGGAPGRDGGAAPPMPQPEQAQDTVPAPSVPDIVLQGLAESQEGEATVRTAILSVGGELVFATAGSTIGGRFTLVAVTGDSIELAALQGGERQTIRLR